MTGLDYFNARYYDPLTGQFLSADVVQGNAQGTSPYAYVGGNPESRTDPTGQKPIGCIPNDPGCGPDGKPTGSKPVQGNPCAVGPQSFNDCTYGSGECKGLTFEGCNAHKAWEYDSEKKREDRLSGLKNQAFWELLGGYLLFALGDMLTIFDKSVNAFDRLGAILDLFATIGNSIIPLIGNEIGGDIAVWADRVSAFIFGGLTLVQGAIAWIKEGNWFQKQGVSAVMNILTSGVGGPISMLVQVLMAMAKPILGNLLDMGGHFLQAAGWADQAEVTRQENMPIQEWCAQSRVVCSIWRVSFAIFLRVRTRPITSLVKKLAVSLREGKVFRQLLRKEYKERRRE